jgi:branched-subunit amino acid ABC-type transport system permease component
LYATADTLTGEGLVQEVLQALLIGLGTGAVYGLLAQGVVMIYRGSGVLNLAHGAFAMISAYVFNELVTAHGWSTVAAALASIVLAGVLGFLTELLVMRPLRGRGTRTPTILLADNLRTACESHDYMSPGCCSVIHEKG